MLPLVILLYTLQWFRNLASNQSTSAMHNPRPAGWNRPLSMSYLGLAAGQKVEETSSE